MKTRNSFNGRFTLVLTGLVSLLALTCAACGAAPDSQGEERVETAPASAVDDGSDAGPAAQDLGLQDPTSPVAPGPVRSAPPGADCPVQLGSGPDEPLTGSSPKTWGRQH